MKPILHALLVLALTVIPGCAGFAYYQGNDLFQSGDYEGAIEQFDEALRLDSANFGALLNRGLANERLGRFKEALEDYTRAIALVPHFGRAYHYRGNVHNKQRHNERAVEDYDLAIQHADAVVIEAQGQLLLTDLSSVYYNRGNSLYQLGRLREAVESYDRALELSPGFPPAANNRKIVIEKLEGR